MTVLDNDFVAKILEGEIAVPEYTTITVKSGIVTAQQNNPVYNDGCTPNMVGWTVDTLDEWLTQHAPGGWELVHSAETVSALYLYPPSEQ